MRAVLRNRRQIVPGDTGLRVRGKLRHALTAHREGVDSDEMRPDAMSSVGRAANRQRVFLEQWETAARHFRRATLVTLTARLGESGDMVDSVVAVHESATDPDRRGTGEGPARSTTGTRGTDARPRGWVAVAGSFARAEPTSTRWAGFVVPTTCTSSSPRAGASTSSTPERASASARITSTVSRRAGASTCGGWRSPRGSVRYQRQSKGSTPSLAHTSMAPASSPPTGPNPVDRHPQLHRTCPT